MLLTLLLLGLHLADTAAAAEEAGSPGCRQIDLGPGRLQVLLDPSGRIDVQTAQTMEFRPATGHRMNFGLLEGVAWLRFALEEDGCLEQMYFRLGNPFMHPVQIYRRAPAPDADWRLEWPTGAATRLRDALAPVQHSLGGASEFLVRVSGPGAVMMAPSVVSGSGLQSAIGMRTVIPALLSGGIVSLAAYCAVLALITGIRGPLAFSVGALAVAMFYAIVSGLLDEIVTPLLSHSDDEAAGVMRASALAVLTASLFHWIFIRSLLAPETLAWRNRTLLLMVLAWVLSVSIVPLLAPAWAAILSMSVVSLAVSVIANQIGVAVRQRHPLARMTMFAFGLVALSVFCFLAMYLGMLPWQPVFIHSIAVAGWAEAVLLSIVIGTHVKELRGEQERLTARTEQLSALSLKDPLTGLGNRRAYDHSVPSELEACRRRGTDAALLVVDIDHFKRVNDQHGHAFGDQVIRSLGAAITDSVRATDLAYRYGGEEFVVLAPALTANRAVEVAERIMEQFAAAGLQAPDGSHPRMSVSIGIAQFQPNDSAEVLFARADAAMYRAKERGRARTEIDPGLQRA